jgi:hypothetical protein
MSSSPTGGGHQLPSVASDAAVSASIQCSLGKMLASRSRRSGKIALMVSATAGWASCATANNLGRLCFSRDASGKGNGTAMTPARRDAKNAGRNEQRIDPTLKGLRWALLKDRSKLSHDHVTDLYKLVAQFTTKRTARAWLYREQMRDILDRKQIFAQPAGINPLSPIKAKQ